MKKWLTLLLALMMTLSLAACSGGDDEERAKKLEPEVMVDAMNDFAKKPSAKTFGTMVGGTLVGDEVAAYIKAAVEAVGMDEEDFIDMVGEDVEGTTIELKKSEELGKDDISDYQEQLDDMVDALKDQLSELEDQKDLLGEDGYEAMHDALEALVKALDGAKISDGLRLTVDNGEDEEDICIFNVDGKWFSEGIFEF